jgi:hypothetical protein
MMKSRIRIVCGFVGISIIQQNQYFMVILSVNIKTSIENINCGSFLKQRYIS